MRTMLISLILTCSLAQLSSAAQKTGADFGCSLEYQCYAPKRCTDDTITLAGSKVIDLDKDAKISSDCDAIIRFHQYTLNWIYVSIISFHAPDKTNSIVFKQVHKLPRRLKNEFSCKIDSDGKRIAQYKYEYENPTSSASSTITSKEINRDGKASIPSVLPFECEFSIRKKLGNNEKFFNIDSGDLITIETNNGVTESKFAPVIDKINCDPLALELNKDEKQAEKKFEPVNFFPKKYGCREPKIFKLEYRNKPTEEFEQIDEDKLTCGGPSMQVEERDVDENAAFRCSADVLYFCDYPVMKKDGEEYPSQVLPDIKQEIKAALKCPETDPHLIIVNDNSEDLIMNATFQCVNYGSQQLWTVHHPTKNIPIKITKEGPVVYCTKTLKCSHFFTLSESAVDNGILNNDLLPECHDSTGKLMSEGREVTSSRCDEESGQFKYTVGGEEKAMNKDTKFLCKYPIEVQDAQRTEKENKEKMTTGIIVALTIGIITIAAGIGVFFAYTTYKKKQNNREIESNIYAEKMKFGSRSVKEAARKAANKNKVSHGSKKPDSAKDSAEKWKDFVLTSRRFAKVVFSGNEDGVFPTLSTNVVKRRPTDDPTTTKQATMDKKYEPKKNTVYAEKKENFKKGYMIYYDSKESGIDKAYAGRAEKIEREKNIGKKQ